MPASPAGGACAAWREASGAVRDLAMGVITPVGWGFLTAKNLRCSRYYGTFCTAPPGRWTPSAATLMRYVPPVRAHPAARIARPRGGAGSPSRGCSGEGVDPALQAAGFAGHQLWVGTWWRAARSPCPPVPPLR